jgi:hypothetical protein
MVVMAVEKEEEEKEAALRNQKEHTVKRELQPRNPRDSVARVGIILSDSGQGREG